MIYKKFIIELQEYYGLYENEHVRKDLYEFIKNNYYESELDQLLRNVKKYFSRKWKSQPDITVIVETEEKYPVIVWGAGGDRIIPYMKINLPDPEEDDREDFCKKQREIFEKKKKQADEKTKHIKPIKEEKRDI